MKTLHEIWAAQTRCFMRANALMYRVAISPDSSLTLTERGKNGVMALRMAIRQRDEARRWDELSAREKAQKGVDRNEGTGILPNDERDPAPPADSAEPTRPLQQNVEGAQTQS